MKKLKVISLITALSLLLSIFSSAVLTVGAAEIDVWDGTTASAYAGGSGTQGDPYQIATPEQLVYFGKNHSSTAGSYYKLTNDIYLNEVSEDSFTKTNVWVNSQTAFNGHFDGDYHIIYGLYVPSSSGGAALFPKITTYGTTTISNIGIKNAEVNGAFAGLIAGHIDTTTNGVTITNCFGDETTKVSGTYAGGIIGYAGYHAYPTVSKCYFTGSVTGTSYAGGIIGGYWSDWTNANGRQITISNSYAATVENAKAIGYVNGPNNAASSAVNVYSTATSGDYSSVVLLTADRLKGDAAATNTNLDFEVTWKAVENGYPTLKAFERKEVTIDTDNIAPGTVWSGFAATKYAGGEGTEANPYLISTGEQLAYFASTYSLENSNGVYYKLTHDIYLNEVSGSNLTKTNQWINSQQYFSGNFDGAGHTVYGIYVPTGLEATYAALIPKVKITGTAAGGVYNLAVKNSEINAIDTGNFAAAAAIIGTIEDNRTADFTVSNCYADETVKVCGRFGSGIIGSLNWNAINTYISNCYFTGSVGGVKVGGIVAYSNTNNGDGKTKGKINNCYTATPENASAIGSTNNKMIGSNVYSTAAAKTFNNEVLLTIDQLKGKAARLNTAFNFLKDWNVVENGYPTLKVFGSTDISVDASGIVPETVWSGKTAIAYAGGTGTAEDPYLISNAEQLAYFASTYDVTNSNGVYYKLTADIYLNEVSGDSFTKTNLWINSQEQFNGHFDGDSHVIYGLYFPTNANISAAFIPTVMVSDTGSVKNLGISHAELTSGFQAASIIGIVNYVGTSFEIDNCFADDTVSINGNWAGGIIGWTNANPKTTVKNTYFTGNVVGANATGGIIGYLADATPVISDSYVATANGDKVIGSEQSITYSHVYSTAAEDREGVTTVAGGTIVGAQARDNMAFDRAFDNYWQTNNGTPILKSFADNGYTATGRLFTSYDINGDGKLNILDLVRIKKISLNIIAGSGDLDGANGCDSTDIIMLKKVLLNGMVDNTSSAVIETTKYGKTLVWHDEFNGNALDMDKWSYANKTNLSSVTYSADEIAVTDGAVSMTSKRIAADTYVVSDGLVTKNTMNFKYGYLEMKAKLPLKQGAWPSLWLVTAEKDYNNKCTAVEIDVFEAVSGTSVIPNVHKWGTNGKTVTIHEVEGNTPSYSVSNPNDWHIYGFEWTASELKFYVDGNCYYTLDITENFGADVVDGMEAFRENVYILISQTVVNSDTAPSTPSDKYISNADALPEYEVDYIRLYQDNADINTKTDIK